MRKVIYKNSTFLETFLKGFKYFILRHLDVEKIRDAHIHTHHPTNNADMLRCLSNKGGGSHPVAEV